MKSVYRILVYTLCLLSVHSFGQQTLTASNASNEGGAIQLINPLKTANNTANNWTFYNMTGPYGNSLQFWNYGNGGFYGSRFTILDNGNVGVGTASPNSTLQIGDSNGSGAPTSEIEVKRLSLAPVTHSGSDWFFTTRDNNLYANLDIGYSNNKTLTLRHDGNVGIGSTSPDSKLTVKGKIHAEEVKVDLAVPADYVFEKYYLGKSSLKPDYTLLTLSEVEKFTEENHHLPNVPSAKEIKEKGLLLGEMSNVLLQKIEELTLYSIDQKKTIEKQAIAIQKLEKENESFKSLSERLTTIEKELKTKK
jgi:hypothetical protein